MKLRLLLVILAFLSATSSHALQSSASALEPSQRQMQTLQLATAILKRFPYRALAMDAAMSERIFDRYIKTLDPEKSIFLQSDIDRFAEARRNLGAEIERGDLKIPFEVFRTYEQRIGERLAHARELLNKGFDFTRNDSFEFNREKAPHPASEDEARAIWHKRVKNDWLQLKLAGKEDAAIRETLDKRYANLVSRIRKYRNDDVFQAFMDAFATSVDPHTDYFAPAESANFDIAMKLSLVGIGAVLQDKDEYATIRELVPGGPAALSSRLKVGDRIVGVGQGSDGPIVDVVGMRLDEVVDLIRGPKDSTVRLNVLPADAGPDGKLELIALVRNKISLEQQAARKTIIEANVEGGKRRVGVISLPAFYQDFDARKRGEGDFRSATRDTIRLLDELKKEGVDAVLVDLRNNGGGSLEEAVALTGLFTGTGPVVQERNAQGQVRVDSSTLPKPAWDGPMGVLINRGSASASEIFAAAIQDYGRGVIIGEPSFGKGTVQTILNLDQIAQNEKAEYGELKMTIAQFFRINGATTQLRGVTPDISFPPITDLEHFGEASYDNALPATHVRAASYSPSQAMADMIPELTRRHTERIARDRQFQLLIEDVAELQARRKSARITLNEAERIKERDARQARLKLRERNDAPADPGARDTAKAGSVEPKTGARRDPLLSAATPGNATEATEKDVVDAWMIEAAHIVADAAALRGNRTRYAAGAAEVAR